MDTRITIVVGLAAAIGALAPATAQRIEISSESLGTVVVTPAPIAGTAPTQVRIPAQSGIDLGLRRNPDGSLRDPLAQPAGRAATAADRTRSDARTRAQGAGAATGSMDRTNGQATVDANASGQVEPGGLPPGGRYGSAASAPSAGFGGGAGNSNGNGNNNGNGADGTAGTVPATGTTGFAR